MPAKLVVLIATCGRPAGVRQVLVDIAQSRHNAEPREVVVVENGATATCAELQQEAWPFQLHYEYTEIRGKNHALNLGLRHISSKFVVFFDDDIRVDNAYFASLLAGMGRWPQATFFAGRVLPAWPQDRPRLPRQLEKFSASWAYAVFEPAQVETTIQSQPMEANMIVSRVLLKEPFPENAGPSGNAYCMGTGRALFARCRRQQIEPVYLPDALVHHIIRPQQMEPQWLAQRAENFGRAVCRNGDSFFGVEKALQLPSARLYWLLDLTRACWHRARGNTWGYWFLWLRSHMRRGVIEELLDQKKDKHGEF